MSDNFEVFPMKQIVAFCTMIVLVVASMLCYNLYTNSVQRQVQLEFREKQIELYKLCLTEQSKSGRSTIITSCTMPS